MKKNYDKVELTLRIVCIVSSILFVAGIVVDCVLCNNEEYDQYSSLNQNITGLCANLAVSYLFFIIAFLPEKRKEKSVNNVIIYFIDKMHAEYDIIVQACNKFDDASNTLDDSPMLQSFLDKDNARKFKSFLQHLISFYQITFELKSELIMFSDYFDNKFRGVFHDYLHCSFLNNIRFLLIENPVDSNKQIFVRNFKVAFNDLTITGNKLFAKE